MSPQASAVATARAVFSPAVEDAARHLFNDRTLDRYRVSMAEGVDRIASRVARVESPFTGVSPDDLAPGISGIDLDRPLDDAGAALEELEEVYLPAHLRLRSRPLQRPQVGEDARPESGGRGRAASRTSRLCCWLGRRSWRRPLEQCRWAGFIPMAVVATAGTTDFGSIDPLPAIARLCTESGAWFHVDAAYGCGLLVSRSRRDLLNGIESADSVTVDFHKSFFQPVSSSALVVRDRAVLGHATYHADYLNPARMVKQRIPNQVEAYQDSMPELVEQFRRFDVFAPEFALSCLNRLQLRNNQEMVDLADPASALQLVGTLENPIARVRRD